MKCMGTSGRGVMKIAILGVGEKLYIAKNAEVLSAKTFLTAIARHCHDMDDAESAMSAIFHDSSFHIAIVDQAEYKSQYTAYDRVLAEETSLTIFEALVNKLLPN